MNGRNICLLGPFITNVSADGEQYQEGAYFYANRKIITIEEEDIRNQIKMASGEIRTRNKKRRKIELELPFFKPFNQFEDEGNPGYDEFEKIINSPELYFQYIGEYDSSTGYYDTYPYYEPVIEIKSGIPRPIEVYIEDKTPCFLDDMIDKPVIKLILMEKQNRYA